MSDQTAERILAATQKERDALRDDVTHAVRCAKEYQPEYPWTQDTASEAVWALGEGLRGVGLANDDLHKELARLRQKADCLDALPSMIGEMCRPDEARPDKAADAYLNVYLRLKAENARLREALGPFADYARAVEKEWPHEPNDSPCNLIHLTTDDGGRRAKVYLGDCRKAREVMGE